MRELVCFINGIGLAQANDYLYDDFIIENGFGA